MKLLDKILNKKPRFIRVGTCKRCGNCCKNVTIKIEGKFITTSEEFEKLRSAKPVYNHFLISGKDENGIFLFACKSLSSDNLRKSYWFRSLYCRSYPKADSNFITAGGETLDGCGYSFKSSIEFKEFLK